MRLLLNFTSLGLNIDVKGIKSLQPISFESSVCEQEDNRNRITKIDENNYEAHFVSGIHFGDSNDWEGKIFLDVSSEAEPVINDDVVCLELDCPTIYEISDDQNRRFGFEAIYNRGKYTAFTIGASTNSLYDSTSV